MSQLLDVVIVGGGPAGSATALALRQLGVERVQVIEASDYSLARVGETIPPDSRLPLSQLGLMHSFDAQNHMRCTGSSSSWGSAELGYNDFIANPHGEGWHLDRLRFDRWMADQAEHSGAEVLRSTRFDGLERPDRGEEFRVRFTTAGGGDSVVSCRFIVDATGRQARLARCMGAKPRFEDQLVCVAGYLEAGPEHGLVSMTLLEAVEHGWWYAALLPGGRLTAAVASDATIIRSMGLTDPVNWRRNLERTLHLGPALVSCPLVEGSLQVWAAPSTLLDPPAGTGWLAVGDAASAFDPISSQGIHKALSNGIAAAPAIAAWIQGDPRGVVQYRLDIANRFLEYLHNRRYFYSVEQRWSDAPFWAQRRSSGPSEPRPL